MSVKVKRNYVTMLNPETGDKLTLVARDSIVDVDAYSGYTEIVKIDDKPPINRDSLSLLKKQTGISTTLHLSGFDSNAGLRNGANV